MNIIGIHQNQLYLPVRVIMSQTFQVNDLVLVIQEYHTVVLNIPISLTKK